MNTTKLKLKPKFKHNCPQVSDLKHLLGTNISFSLKAGDPDLTCIWDISYKLNGRLCKCCEETENAFYGTPLQMLEQEAFLKLRVQDLEIKLSTHNPERLIKNVSKCYSWIKHYK